MSDLRAELQCNAKTFLSELLAALDEEIAALEGSLPGGRSLSLTPGDHEYTLLLEGAPGGPFGYYLSATNTKLSAGILYDVLERITSHHLEPEWNEARGECVVFVGIQSLNVEEFKQFLLNSLLQKP